MERHQSAAERTWQALQNFCSVANPKVQLGRIIISRRVEKSVDQAEVIAALTRHAKGDWGELVEQDWPRNEAALTADGIVLSVYGAQVGRLFWILTDVNDEKTSVLFPEEY